MNDFLTYEEAAQILGVTPEAIRCRAKRGSWRRSIGNDGRARIVLPEGIDRARPGGDRVGATGRRPDDDRVRLAELETELRILRELVVDLRKDRDRWQVVAEQLLRQSAMRQAPVTAVSEIIQRMRDRQAAKAA